MVFAELREEVKALELIRAQGRPAVRRAASAPGWREGGGPLAEFSASVFPAGYRRALRRRAEGRGSAVARGRARWRRDRGARRSKRAWSSAETVSSSRRQPLALEPDEAAVGRTEQFDFGRGERGVLDVELHVHIEPVDAAAFGDIEREVRPGGRLGKSRQLGAEFHDDAGGHRGEPGGEMIGKGEAGDLAGVTTAVGVPRVPGQPGQALQVLVGRIERGVVVQEKGRIGRAIESAGLGVPAFRWPRARRAPSGARAWSSTSRISSALLGRRGTVVRRRRARSGSARKRSVDPPGSFRPVRTAKRPPRAGPARAAEPRRQNRTRFSAASR